MVCFHKLDIIQEKIVKTTSKNVREAICWSFIKNDDIFSFRIKLLLLATLNCTLFSTLKKLLSGLSLITIDFNSTIENKEVR